MSPAAFDLEGSYLDTASLGVPPSEARHAMEQAIAAWATGRARAPDYDQCVQDARETFARLVGVASSDVAVAAQVSVFTGMVSSSLASGAEVLLSERDFTSVLFPFLVARTRGVRVRAVPLGDLADAVTERTTLVALSAVQSADGTVADLPGIAEAAEAHGARTFIDATQACGWLPLSAEHFDFVVCGAYKWLLSPRGTAFMTVRRERLHEIRPVAAGWYAGPDPWDSIYGLPLRLASDARRLDVSPAWLCWSGTAPALRFVERIGVAAIHQHNLRLANRFRAGIGLTASNSAIVAVSLPGAAQRLRQAGVTASTREGVLRASFHLYNTDADVEKALDNISGEVDRCSC